MAKKHPKRHAVRAAVPRAPESLLNRVILPLWDEIPFRVEERYGLPAGSLIATGAAGRKDDASKTRVGLMVTDFPRALELVAKVSTFGANKYAPRSWRTVPDAVNRYTDALYRHLLAAASGEVNDSETGLPHRAHAAWNALALLELELGGPK